MTTAKPYLIRAIYEWILDNNHTPYIAVDASIPYTTVPQQYTHDNSITLDISPTATQQLLIDNKAVTCKARFGGIIHEIYIPIAAVVAIYAQENNQGMSFPKEEYQPTLNDLKPLKPKKIQLKITPGGKNQDSLEKK